MLQSFRSRLVLSNLLVTLLGLLVVVFVFTQLLVNRSTEVKKADRAAQAQGVASQVEALFARHGGPKELQQQIDLASRLLGVRVIVTTMHSRIPPVDSRKDTRFYATLQTPLDPVAFRKGKAAARALFNNSNLVFFQAPLRGHVNRNLIGAVVLIAKVQDVQPSLGAFAQILLTVLGSALAVWLVIGIYFAVSISRPLVRVTEATTRMAQGDYSVRVRVPGSSEIGQLAGSFNDMAEEVQRTNRLLRDFVANVSHDLRTPLTSIAGFSGAVVDGTASGNELQSTAAIIHEEALKMQRLVDDLLQLTKLESGLLKLEVHSVPLRPFVANVLDRIEKSAGDRPLPRLVNSIPAQLPAAALDEVQFERALQNLLDNAIQYTGSDGSVTVGGSTFDERTIEMTVADSGRGISSDELSRIFERFYRSDKSRERAHGHAGLGLAIVKEVVEGHGGAIHVESRVGEGTTFRISMPRAAPQPQNEGPRRIEGARPAVSRG